MFSFSVRGQRVGRIAFGVVLLAGAAILVHRLVMARPPSWDRPAAWAAYVIPATWAAAFAAYVIGGRIGSRRALDHAGELAVPALVVPSVGAALLLPLTVHLPFWLALTREVHGFDVRGFDEWAALAGFLTIPTHLIFAALVALRALQLARGALAITPLRIFGICVGISCVPLAILVFPPMIVMMTGIPLLVPLSYMESLAARDRERGAAEAIPCAIAVRRA
jgi:hypothetical protein